MKLPSSVKWIAAAALALAAVAPSLAQEPVRIGYAIARTGPWAAGAQVTQEPNYIMWAEQVNAAGGLNVKGVKRKIELIGFDDRSDTETVVRTYEKLMGSDKVDLILPPWSTGANFAMMPLAQKYGYPMLAPTATGRKLLGMKNPYFFALLQQPDLMMDALAEYLAARSAKTAAVLYVDELFGLEKMDALEAALKSTRHPDRREEELSARRQGPAAGAERRQGEEPRRVRRAQLPAGHVPDHRPGARHRLQPEALLRRGRHRLPGVSRQVRQGRRGRDGPRLLEPATSPAAKAYFDAHVKRWQKEPDRWASAHAWAGLQILQTAVEKVGLDRKAIRDYIASNEYDTIIGKIRFKDGENVTTPGAVSQWQNGEFEVVWPPDRATSPALYPKPAW